jgi:hypothetical protein
MSSTNRLACQRGSVNKNRPILRISGADSQWRFEALDPASTFIGTCS